MAYIWKFGKAPDYLTAVRDTAIVSKEIASSLSRGNKIIENIILKFDISKRHGKEATSNKVLEWDVLNSASAIPLVNEKVLKILKPECPGKFQAIPSIIKLPDGSEINDYWVINVTNKVPIASLKDCIKHERYKDEKDIRASIFYTAAYQENIIDKEDLCRDSILEANRIFISERLHSIFKKEKIKGGGFYKSLRDSVVFV